MVQPLDIRNIPQNPLTPQTLRNIRLIRLPPINDTHPEDQITMEFIAEVGNPAPPPAIRLIDINLKRVTPPGAAAIEAQDPAAVLLQVVAVNLLPLLEVAVPAAALAVPAAAAPPHRVQAEAKKDNINNLQMKRDFIPLHLKR